MRLSLFFVFALSVLGCGGGSSSYRLPVDSPVYPYQKPAAEDLAAEDSAAPSPTGPGETFDEDLINEEVPDSGDEGE